MKRLFAIVHGRVQGVGFRAATLQTARALELAGWVRNRPDGSVETVADGDELALKRLESFLRRGPPGAHVRHVDVSWEPAGEGTDRLKGFEIR
ncbi:MAG TPA: acylphosphatase [Polyangia bacterium]|nr:acylphosphatase [Polyangia bacterium]